MPISAPPAGMAPIGKPIAVPRSQDFQERRQSSADMKTEPLTGSIFSEVPVVTIEMVVLSDASDAEFIKTEEGQRRMADSIADGVTRFVAPAKTVSTGKNQ